MMSATLQGLTIRHDLRPGDLGMVTALHGTVYATEYGFDHRCEAYIAETLVEFGRSSPPGPGCLWLAEMDSRLVGSIGIVGREGGAAQLRWFLVAPDVRGHGLGRRLVGEGLAYCRAEGYRSVYLWTLHVLTAAAHVYLTHGFRMTEERPEAPLFGAILKEQRYDLSL